MQTLHRALMAGMLVLVLAVAVGIPQPWSATAAAQHGQHDDPQAHFDLVAERLELSDAQRQALEEPFHEAFAAMQTLHRVHAVIADELTDAQQEHFTEMIHQMLGREFPVQRHGEHPHGEAHR